MADSITVAQASEPDDIAAEVAKLDRQRIIATADTALASEPLTITSFRAKLSEGGTNDYYSNGDYWWRDPSKEDGLPYIRPDGETNPENFDSHRQTLCHLLSNESHDLWSYEGSEGRSMRRAVEYLYPYIADKSSWPLQPDVQSWEGWPTRQSSLLFSTIAFENPSFLKLWKRLSPDPEIEEIQRNVAITQPTIWLRK